MSVQINDSAETPPEHLQALVRTIIKAHSYAESDPEVALTQARKSAEAICRSVFSREIGEPSDRIMLDELIRLLRERRILPRRIVVPFATIQTYGNYGTHAQSEPEEIDVNYAAPCLSALIQATSWYFTEYLKVEVPEGIQSASVRTKRRAHEDLRASLEAEIRGQLNAEHREKVAADELAWREAEAKAKREEAARERRLRATLEAEIRGQLNAEHHEKVAADELAKREAEAKAKREEAVRERRLRATLEAEIREQLKAENAAEDESAPRAGRHEAEVRARTAGSTRATLRVPKDAEDIKAKIIDLHNATIEIKRLRRDLASNFYSMGTLLRDICVRKLYEARGFGSFEGFLDREIDIGKTTSLRLVRIVEVFQPEAAKEFGMEETLVALQGLESRSKSPTFAPPVATGGRA